MSGLAKLAIPPQVLAAWQVAKIALPCAAFVGAGIYIAVLKVELRHDGKTIDTLTSWQRSVQTAVQQEVRAADPKRTKFPDYVADIHWLGGERGRAVAALAEQNAAVEKANAAASQAQEGVAIARKRAEEAQQALSATKAALIDPKRSGGLTAAEWGML